MNCYVPTLDIVKLVNGNVEFYDAVTGAFIKMLSADIVRIDIVGDSVIIIQDNGSIERIHKDNVINTQILPAAAVPFVGTAADLAALLSASFFFVSSGIALPLPAVDVSYDNAVSGLAATDVQAAIDEVSVLYDVDYNKLKFQSFLETTPVIISSAVGIGTNLLLAFPIRIKKGLTINKLIIEIIGPVAGDSVWGLYDSIDGLPNNLTFQSTPFNNGVGGVATYTLGVPQVIKKGLYFVGYNTSSVNPVNLATASISSVAGIIGQSSTNRPCSLFGRNLAYSAILPASFGSPTNYYGSDIVTGVPFVQFEITY